MWFLSSEIFADGVTKLIFRNRKEYWEEKKWFDDTVVSGKGFLVLGNGKGNWKSHSCFTGRERELENATGREGKFEARNPGKSRESYKKVRLNWRFFFTGWLPLTLLFIWFPGFPGIPGITSLKFPFPSLPVAICEFPFPSRKTGMWFSISLPVPGSQKAFPAHPWCCGPMPQ